MRVLLSSCLLVFFATACGEDPPPPTPAAIARFEAVPPTVMRGARTQLEWEVTEARRLRLLDDTGQVLLEEDDPMPAGQLETGPLQGTTRFTLEVEGRGEPASTRRNLEVRLQLPAPRFLETDALPSQILAGQAAALSWRTENALAVDVRTSTGAIVLEAGPTEGQVVVRPRGSTTYELTARGVESNDTAQLTVLVGNRPPSIERFVATPSVVPPGEQVALTWQTVGATEVSLRSATSTLMLSGLPPRGTRTVRPRASSQFILTARSVGGSRSATVAVTVRQPAALAIDRFTVEPNPAARGAPLEASWSVRGANQVQIAQDGAVIQRSPAPSGRIPITIPGGSASLVLTASGAAGAQQQRALQAFVHDAPVLTQFELSPTARPSTGTVGFTWDVANVTQLALFRNGTPVGGFPVLTATSGPQQRATGTVTVTATATARYVLEGASAAGAVSEARLFVLGRTETEPNEDASGALPPPLAGATASYLGGGGSGDLDVYLVDVPAGGSVSAQTSSGPGFCDVDTRLIFRGPTGELADDDDGGVSTCSRLDPSTHPGVGRLPAGRYEVWVVNLSGGPYALTIGPGAQQCGNRVLEAPETCDDGNLISNDGCAATCGLEAQGPILTPPANAADLVTPSMGAAVVRLALTVPGQSLTATAASPDGRCNTIDTRLELLDATGRPLVDARGGGPVGTAGTCGAFAFAPGATDLRQGLYYLRVSSENARGGTVRVRYTVEDPVCGNGRLESLAGEQCDDGNTTAGDGCAPTCVFEGGAAPEQEPNGRQATATATGLVGVGRVQLRGEIRPSGDDDVFAFEVPALTTVVVRARTYTLRGQPTSCDRNVTDTRIFLEQSGQEAFTPGSGEIAFNDDINSAGNVWCSEISNVRLSGGPLGQTFYLRIQGWRDQGTATWFLDIETR